MKQAPESIEFLGWDRPALHVAAERLAAVSSRRDELDLSRVAVVVPGARAGRLLLSLLTQQSAAAPKPFCPPTISTPGEVPELVLGSHPRVAGELATLMAWVTVLKGLDVATFRDLAGEPPPLDEFTRWLGLAEMLVRCEAQLAAAGLTMQTVAALADEFGPGFAKERWSAAAEAQASRDALLRSCSLIERHAARREALQATDRGASRFDRLVLVGVAELPPIAKQAILASGIATTVLVHGRDADRDMLDDWGMPRTDAAGLLEVHVDRESIVFTDSARDQAHEALAASLEGEPACDETTLCIADESLTSVVTRVASEAGVSVHRGAGTLLQKLRIWKLVAAIRRHLSEDSIESLRSLVRQPDIERFAGIRGSLIPRLDDYAEQTLHQSMSEPWRAEARRYATGLEGVARELHGLLAPLREADGGGVADQLLAMLATVLKDDAAHPADLRPADHRAFKAFRDVVDLFREPDARTLLKGVGSVQVLGLILRSASRAAVPDDVTAPSLELVGWLESALDPSPRLTVAGFNEGIVPGATGADPLLTETMRMKLGLPHAATRNARDAWLLRTLMGSKRRLRLVCGRRSVDGDPLRPSRFLLSAAPEELPGRVLTAMGKAAGTKPRRVRPLATRTGGSGFVVPVMTPTPVSHDDRFSVTSFRTYIESPYQFYLKHVLGLEEAAPPGREASAATFGNLVHAALKVFSDDTSLRHATDTHRIEAALLAGLEAEARKAFGAVPSPAVTLQVEIAKRRLRTLAAWQAARTSEGWIIAEAEWPPRGTVVEFPVDDRAATITGQIDRIERHAKDGRLAILDFKTGDQPRKPADAYKVRSREWKDLQLPLYRHLAASLGADDGSLLAYVNIGAELDAIDVREAKWDPATLHAADETAKHVIQEVRAGRFHETGKIGAFNPIHAAMAGQGFEADDEGEAE
ncbi:MAG: PD-(D/E)XK nuclease family protein [Phycisphaerae bacterium]